MSRYEVFTELAFDDTAGLRTFENIDPIFMGDFLCGETGSKKA